MPLVERVTPCAPSRELQSGGLRTARNTLLALRFIAWKSVRFDARYLLRKLTASLGRP